MVFRATDPAGRQVALSFYKNTHKQKQLREAQRTSKTKVQVHHCDRLQHSDKIIKLLDIVEMGQAPVEVYELAENGDMFGIIEKCHDPRESA